MIPGEQNCLVTFAIDRNRNLSRDSLIGLVRPQIFIKFSVGIWRTFVLSRCVGGYIRPAVGDRCVRTTATIPKARNTDAARTCEPGWRRTIRESSFASWFTKFLEENDADQAGDGDKEQTADDCSDDNPGYFGKGLFMFCCCVARFVIILNGSMVPADRVRGNERQTCVSLMCYDAINTNS